MWKNASLRQRIWVFGLSLLALCFVILGGSLYKLDAVRQTLDAIHQQGVPWVRLLTRVKSDGFLLKKELLKQLTYPKWKQAFFVPRGVPLWLEEVLEGEMQQIQKQMKTAQKTLLLSKKWQDWQKDVSQTFQKIQNLTAQLVFFLKKKDTYHAIEMYPSWVRTLERWSQTLDWSVQEAQGVLRIRFQRAKEQVRALQMALQGMLIGVLFLSLLLLWLGKKVLAPLREFLFWVRKVSQKGLQKEDPLLVPAFSLDRKDEISDLAREFRNMAVVLFERERAIEQQKKVLRIQNQRLRDVTVLNESILKGLTSFLFLVDQQGCIQKANPAACKWLRVEESELVGKRCEDFASLEPFILYLKEIGKTFSDPWKESVLCPLFEKENQLFRAQWIPLGEEKTLAQGLRRGSVILWVQDQSKEQALEQKLHRAEHLAAMGRLSAQVAHEIRNPLHAIFLEAEYGLSVLEKSSVKNKEEIRVSLKSILENVERLKGITEHYLKMSRPQKQGTQEVVALGVVFESVLATYAPVLEARNVLLDWKQEEEEKLLVKVEKVLLEHALGNLLKNAMEAMDGEKAILIENEQNKVSKTKWVREKKIFCSMGIEQKSEKKQVWFKIWDQGGGVSKETQRRLFEPFFTTKTKGTGLGLAFSKTVLQRQGGDLVYLESEARQKHGACFKLVLPLWEEAKRRGARRNSTQMEMEKQTYLDTGREPWIPKKSEFYL